MVNQIIGCRRVTFIKKCEKWVKFSTLIRLISTSPLHISSYITKSKLLMQCLRLNKTCRMSARLLVIK